ncbi:TRIM3 protein, partial [Atractosteus spatula]|nr:TRIM3 protein [Atractosteus spatula]
MHLEECIASKHSPTARTSRDTHPGAPLTEGSRSVNQPGFWGFPSCSEENGCRARIFRKRNSAFKLVNLSRLSQGRRRGHLVCPTGVAVTHDGFVFITDCSNNKVRVLDSSRDMWVFFRKMKETPSKQGGSPAGIAISSLGYLVVIAEPEKKQVSVYARDGRRLFSLKLNWMKPFGVAVTSKGQIVVTDNCENGSLSVLTVDWTNGSVLHLQLIGGLEYPCFVACSKKDDTAVTTKNSVKLYDATGNLTWSSSLEQGNNQVFICPKGIAIDSDNNVIVSDYSSGKIVLLSSEGRWLMDIVSSGLMGPQGLALSPDGLLVIADSQNHSIKVYSYRPVTTWCQEPAFND